MPSQPQTVTCHTCVHRWSNCNAKITNKNCRRRQLLYNWWWLWCYYIIVLALTRTWPRRMILAVICYVGPYKNRSPPRDPNAIAASARRQQTVMQLPCRNGQCFKLPSAGKCVRFNFSLVNSCLWLVAVTPLKKMSWWTNHPIKKEKIENIENHQRKNNEGPKQTWCSTVIWENSSTKIAETRMCHLMVGLSRSCLTWRSSHE